MHDAMDKSENLKAHEMIAMSNAQITARRAARNAMTVPHCDCNQLVNNNQPTLQKQHLETTHKPAPRRWHRDVVNVTYDNVGRLPQGTNTKRQNVQSDKVNASRYNTESDTPETDCRKETA